eukprot:305821-Pyramimonas_sp.AAC.1
MQALPSARAFPQGSLERFRRARRNLGSVAKRSEQPGRTCESVSGRARRHPGSASGRSGRSRRDLQER